MKRGAVDAGGDDRLPLCTSPGVCCKCGCSNVSTRWTPAVTMFDLPEPVYRECMKRTCTRCGYSWDERPLDDFGNTDSNNKPQQKEIHMGNNPTSSSIRTTKISTS